MPTPFSLSSKAQSPLNDSEDRQEYGAKEVAKDAAIGAAKEVLSKRGIVIPDSTL